MKKVYISPVTEKIEVRVEQHLLDGSTVGLTASPASIDNEGNYETLSRESSLWDDEY